MMRQTLSLGNDSNFALDHQLSSFGAHEKLDRGSIAELIDFTFSFFCFGFATYKSYASC
jgi:hypothetical protein